MSTIGYKQTRDKFRKLSLKSRGKTIRSAAMTATLPAVHQMRADAPVGNPPYFYPARISTGDKTAGRREAARIKDPYPVKSYLGFYRIPTHASRNIRRISKLYQNNTIVSVLIAPSKSAFYSVAFHEFGTSKIPAKPWFERAFKKSIPAMDKRLRDQLVRKIDKAVL